MKRTCLLWWIGTIFVMITFLVNNILFLWNHQSHIKRYQYNDDPTLQLQKDDSFNTSNMAIKAQKQQHQSTLLPMKLLQSAKILTTSDKMNDNNDRSSFHTAKKRITPSRLSQNNQTVNDELLNHRFRDEQSRVSFKDKVINGINSKFLEEGTSNRGESKNYVMLNLTVKEHWFWKGRLNAACKLIQSKSKVKLQKPLLVQMKDISCQNISKDLSLGEGNVLLGFYAMRLAFARHGVDFSISCQRKHTKNNNSLIWYLQGFYPSNLATPYQNLPKKRDTCRGMGSIPLQYTSEFIRHDLRKLAVSIFGPREDIPESKKYLQQSHQNIYLASSLDDVAIHFRCGDLLKGLPTEDYGFLKFQSYTNLIDKTASSIGIITSPFDPNDIRMQDQGTGPICRYIVIGFQQYIQTAFPNMTVSIHNGPNETIPISYGRLILAKKQTFTGPSTFGIFPAIASFGIGYIQKGKVNYFAPPIANHYDDVKLMTGPILSSKKIRKIGIKAAFQWMMDPIIEEE